MRSLYGVSCGMILGKRRSQGWTKSAPYQNHTPKGVRLGNPSLPSFPVDLTEC